MLESISVALGIFVLRVLGNTITTLRLVMLARGRTGMVFILGACESLIFAIALGSVVNNLHSILNLAAYSLGFATGGNVGIWLERKLTTGYITLHIVSTAKGHEIAMAIRAAGFGATEFMGLGAEGEVMMVESTVERKNLAACTAAIQQTDPQAFITTHALQSTRRGYIPAVRPGLARFLNR
ncbi:MAG: DUF2179 domain-containing protein [Anaerolineales bacterium]|nr:DUF2179 domain-containing protein [Anaerolineales bacterium]